MGGHGQGHRGGRESSAGGPEEQDSADAQATEAFELVYPTVARVMNEGRRVGLTATDVFDARLSLIIGNQ